MRLVAGRASQRLAQKISKILAKPLVQLSVGEFPNGEIHCELQEDIAGENIALIQSFSRPINDNIVEALIIIAALKNAGAASVVLIVPYFGYSRQDCGVVSSAKVIIESLERSGVDQFVVVDSHSEAFRSYFKGPLLDLSIRELVEDDLQGSRDMVFVSPDLGRVHNAKELSRRFDVQYAYIKKHRDKNGLLGISGIIGDVCEKDCIIVDDIVDSGGTLCGAVRLLRKAGARSVKAYVTHAVLSCCSATEIMQEGLDELVVMDSIDNVNLKMTKCFRSITMSGLIANAIKEVCQNKGGGANLFEMI